MEEVLYFAMTDWRWPGSIEYHSHTSFLVCGGKSVDEATSGRHKAVDSFRTKNLCESPGGACKCDQFDRLTGAMTIGYYRLIRTVMGTSIPILDKFPSVPKGLKLVENDLFRIEISQHSESGRGSAEAHTYVGDGPWFMCEGVSQVVLGRCLSSSLCTMCWSL